MFNAFLLKLTPARRFIYLISVLTIIIGTANNYDSYIYVGVIMLNVLLAFELVDKLIFKDEISLAKKIQEKLTPQTPPLNKFYDIASYYESATEVSGDYFDFTNTKNDETTIIIGDISGKGMAAALLMIRVQAMIDLLLNFSENFKELLISLNKNFYNKKASGYFLTLSLTKINGEGNLSLFNAGHTPTLYYNKNKDELLTINPKGIGIGLCNNSIFDNSLEEININPKTDDVLFFFTDGLTEAMDRYKAQFGMKRLEKMVKENIDKTPQAIINAIKTEIDIFRKGSTVQDDLTIIILKKK